MSYYDFEHFWSPKQVCAQKSPPKSKIKTTTKIKKLIGELLGRDFRDENAVISTPKIPDPEPRDNFFD